MTTSIASKAGGTQGSLQINGVDSLVFDSTGLLSGDTNTLNKTFGYNQAWTDVKTTPGRVAGTTYTNTTGKPIFVYVSALSAAAGYGSFTVGSVTCLSSSSPGAGNAMTYSFVVPVGVSYSVSSLNISSINSWNELR